MSELYRYCFTCHERHENGYTHQPAVLHGTGIYVCERCAEDGRGAIAVGDGTLCRHCIREMDR